MACKTAVELLDERPRRSATSDVAVNIGPHCFEDCCRAVWPMHALCSKRIKEDVLKQRFIAFVKSNPPTAKE